MALWAIWLIRKTKKETYMRTISQKCRNFNKFFHIKITIRMTCICIVFFGSIPCYATDDTDILDFLPAFIKPKIAPSKPPFLFRPLNDTGIIWGSNYPNGNNSSCSGTEIGAQDCSYGRDTTQNDNSDGFAGFSFTKLDANGNPLADQTVSYTTTPWDCVQDNVTGLTWQIKPNDGGPNDRNQRFSWYDTNPSTNGGWAGEQNKYGGGNCGHVNNNPATYCNTEAYVARVNAAGLCGRSDWRMPTITELESIVAFDVIQTCIVTSFFPDNGWNKVFWSGTSYAYFFDPYDRTFDQAWIVDFHNGSSYTSYRTIYHSIRLVSGD